MTFLLEPILPKIIISKIKPKHRSLLQKLAVFDSIDSTNSYLLDQVNNTTPSGYVCLANEQTQGRGRFQRPWISPPGANIYCSLFWRFAHARHDLSGLSLAVAVMVTNALQQYGIKQGIQLKWPNDILFSGRKLGGILLETNSMDSIVIGIGLNLYLPDMALPTAIAINEIVPDHFDRNQLIGLLLNELLKQLPVFEKRGLKAFIEEWRRQAIFQGKEIIVMAADKKITGTMLGVNNAGELLLRDSAGIAHCFQCGEVSVREMQS